MDLGGDLHSRGQGFRVADFFPPNIVVKIVIFALKKTENKQKETENSPILRFQISDTQKFNLFSSSMVNSII